VVYIVSESIQTLLSVHTYLQKSPSNPYYTNMILLNNKLCYHLLPDTVTECLYSPPDGRIVMVFV
jgi:hypothetical protein